MTTPKFGLESKELSKKIEEVKKITGLKVNSYKVITSRAKNFIIEINKIWIFRFPKNSIIKKETKKRWNFLASFSEISPIQVPKPEFITNHLIGYRKISGEPLLPTQIEKLNNKSKLKIAKQIGLFLKALHNYKDKSINFDTGYLVMRRKDYKTYPKEFAKYLKISECKVLETMIKKIAQNSSNFRKPTNIIHGDFNLNNFLWDKKRKVITGIVDWSDMGLGIPAMDFIGIADFNSHSNDLFLKDTLKWYGTKNNGLFNQIKANAIVDVMNWFWFYKKTGNPKGVSRVVTKIKTILRS
ncbi:aminoglycoside phosphotransferase family protein [Pedobacter sp.]|jgi:aminoglycoside 2''-phosphotransferase|uniref:phosphotransferase family protein n=1 Tax=Pedobacter sp. TaxID=1411316 RepID=UPI002C3BE26D|nr:aminoglycoside phosphotransferase family protein [Pedobacter sp.]HWW38689.1 aminoglycoside phosphotransferase family protein [Pedobacter sp.]